MAYTRIEPQRPEGWQDPSDRYTNEQLEGFWKDILAGSDNIDETIDTYCHRKSEVSVLEILNDDKYRDVRWKLHQPVVPCCLTTFSGYLRNIGKWFSLGRLAWYGLAILAELDRKIFRENQMQSIAGEINSIAQRLKRFIETRIDENQEVFYDHIRRCSSYIELYANFLNDTISGRLVTWRFAFDENNRSLDEIEYNLRYGLTSVFKDIIILTEYDPAEDFGNLYETFKQDAEGLLEDASEDLTDKPANILVPSVFVEKFAKEDAD